MDNDLLKACKNGNLDDVKYLVSLGCDPKVNNNYAIRHASSYGHLKVVKYLVSVGCDPKACNNWAILDASAHGYLDVVTNGNIEANSPLFH